VFGVRVSVEKYMCKYVQVSVGLMFVCLQPTTTITTTTNTNIRKLVAAGGWRFVVVFIVVQTKTGAKQNAPENPLNADFSLVRMRMGMRRKRW